jgi:hypothetical protein
MEIADLKFSRMQLFCWSSSGGGGGGGGGDELSSEARSAEVLLNHYRICVYVKYLVSIRLTA